MESGSRSNGGDGFDDDDGLAARREVSSSLQGTPIPLNSALVDYQFWFSEALGRQRRFYRLFAFLFLC